MKNIVRAITAALLLSFSMLAFSQDEAVEGGSLYLVRNGFETHRAEFDDALDCEYIAKVMNEKEPLVTWLCSTSEKPRVFSCLIKGLTIIDHDGEVSVIPSMDFELSLNRGRASSDLPSPRWNVAKSFTYTETDQVIKLTNDYPYVAGNFISYAIAYITIDPETSAARALDFDMQDNGSGQCKLIN